MNKPEYRFECRIVDMTTGDTVIKADTYLSSSIGFDGSCESVDMEVASMMRAFDKGDGARDRHEVRNYADDELEQL